MGGNYLTAFEDFFKKLGLILNIQKTSTWPTFPNTPVTDYTITNIKNLGTVLVINCNECDGPSDLRHTICKQCVRSVRERVEREESVIPPKKIVLTRIFTM